MALLDLLSSLIGQTQIPQSPPVAGSAGDPSNDLTVTAPRPASQAHASVSPLASILGLSTSKPDMPTPISQGLPQTGSPNTVDYNNKNQVNAVNSAVQGEGTPPGGGANPGVYGLLPQNLQHGTLRNVLGALGDAFLVGSGRQAIYRPRMENEQMGQAMAGMDINDPQSVAAATQRIAATGAPGSIEMADKLQQQAEQAQLRQQYMQYNQNYRDQMIGSKHDVQYNRMAPTALADLSQAKNADEYSTKLAMWDKRIGVIDPKVDAATALGLPPEYIPGFLTQNAGMTNNQIQSSQNRRLGIQQSGANAAMAAGSRTGAASISANRPSDPAILQSLITKQNNGQQLTPAEQAAFSKLTNLGRGGRPLLTSAAGGGAQPQFIEGHVYHDARGNTAVYRNGKFVPQ